MHSRSSVSNMHEHSVRLPQLNQIRKQTMEDEDMKTYENDEQEDTGKSEETKANFSL